MFSGADDMFNWYLSWNVHVYVGWLRNVLAWEKNMVMWKLDCVWRLCSMFVIVLICNSYLFQVDTHLQFYTVHSSSYNTYFNICIGYLFNFPHFIFWHLNKNHGVEVDCQPLNPKVPGSSPMICRFWLWDFFTQTAQVLVKSPGSRHQAWLI